MGQGSVKSSQLTGSGLKIKLDSDPGLFVNKIHAVSDQRLILAKQFWKNTPYMKVYLSPANQNRSFIVIWPYPYKNNQYSQIHVTLKAKEDYFIIDTRQKILWKRTVPFPENRVISQIGIQFSNEIEVRKIEFLSVLDPLDFLKTLYKQIISEVEPIKISSINFHYGLTVLGNSLTGILGILIIISGFYVLIVRSRQSVIALATVIYFSVLLLDVTYIRTLWNYAGKSYEQSSLYSDRFAEWKSRFGEEFARLDRELKQHIPEQAKVAFPRSRKYLVQGESNWIWFLYYGEYEDFSNRLKVKRFSGKFDYMMYFYPEKIYFDAASHHIIDKRDSSKKWRVDIISKISDQAMILKVIND